MSQVTSKGENPIHAQPNSLHSLALGGELAAPFWLVVPTYNPGLANWAQWLQALQSQNCQPAHVVVVDFRGDLISAERVYWDQASVYRQAGVAVS